MEKSKGRLTMIAIAVMLVAVIALVLVQLPAQAQTTPQGQPYGVCGDNTTPGLGGMKAALNVPGSGTPLDVVLTVNGELYKFTTIADGTWREIGPVPALLGTTIPTGLFLPDYGGDPLVLFDGVIEMPTEEECFPPAIVGEATARTVCLEESAGVIVSLRASNNPNAGIAGQVTVGDHVDAFIIGSADGVWRDRNPVPVTYGSSVDVSVIFVYGDEFRVVYEETLTVQTEEECNPPQVVDWSIDSQESVCTEDGGWEQWHTFTNSAESTVSLDVTIGYVNAGGGPESIAPGATLMFTTSDGRPTATVLIKNGEDVVAEEMVTGQEPEGGCETTTTTSTTTTTTTTTMPPTTTTTSTTTTTVPPTTTTTSTTLAPTTTTTQTPPTTTSTAPPTNDGGWDHNEEPTGSPFPLTEALVVLAVFGLLALSTTRGRRRSES